MYSGAASSIASPAKAGVHRSAARIGDHWQSLGIASRFRNGGEMGPGPRREEEERTVDFHFDPDFFTNSQASTGSERSLISAMSSGIRSTRPQTLAYCASSRPSRCLISTGSVLICAISPANGAEVASINFARSSLMAEILGLCVGAAQPGAARRGGQRSGNPALRKPSK
jgi:hypothetical protein